MPKMRAVQVPRAGRPVGNCRARYSRARSGLCADQSPGLRHLPQRYGDQRWILSRHSISARSRTRSGRRDRCGRPQTSPAGRPDNAWAWAGTADSAAIATTAAAAIFSPARLPRKLPASRAMAAMPSTCSRPSARWHLVPDELSSVDAAPLMCAGVTTFNCLRNSGARPGDLVAVVGIGGLGHLAVQYAAKMGCKTVAIARGKDEEPSGPPTRRALLTSTTKRRIPRRNCKSWAARKSSSPPSPAPTP